MNLIFNNLYLNFNIWYCTYVCWLCSCFTENHSSWSWSMKPIPKVVLSQLVTRANLRQHTRVPIKITTMLCRWGSLSPYKDDSSLLRWQANIIVHIPLPNCIKESMRQFWCVSVLSCLWDYLVVCGFGRTIRTCVCFFFVCESLVVGA
jgi:hypothetical protein